jgi:xanthine dehydrogenase accessory factor
MTMHIFERVATLTKKGTPLMLVSVIEKKGEGPVDVGKKMIVYGDNQAEGTVGGGMLEFTARNMAVDFLQRRQSTTETFLLQEGTVIEDATTLDMACGGVVTLFFEYVGPQEFIYVFGAGHVGQALVNVLQTMNFYITVIDDRQDVIDAFKGGHQVIHKPFVGFIEENGLQPHSFVVVCTPSHKHDYNVLHALLQHKIPVKYAGMLCSLEKLKDYIDRTQETFGTTLQMDHFYSPIGLDIGGGSPEEIAISIASEILAIHYNKKGHKHMREKIDDSYRYWTD